MSYVPDSLAELGTYWTRKGGVNLGVIGNQRHCAGYHLGKDRIMSSCACKPDGTCVPGKRWADYSVVTTRDKAGLTNAASAIDLGKLNGSLAELHKFSDWLARRCLAGQPGTNDVREVIYSPDGVRVLGFKDGVGFLIRDYGDRSHLTHTHISFYRDSEKRDKRPLFTPYFDLPDTSEDPVPGLAFTMTDPTPGRIKVKNIQGVLALQLHDQEAFPFPPGTERDTFGLGRCAENIGGSGSPMGYLIGDELAVIPAGQVDFTPDTIDCAGPVGAQRERDRAESIRRIEEQYA